MIQAFVGRPGAGGRARTPECRTVIVIIMPASDPRVSTAPDGPLAALMVRVHQRCNQARLGGVSSLRQAQPPE